ncbi:MAG: hypothetical protein LBG19_03430 [Prevotellaceae bacterium]|jgi:hypothetical protein|nr:hypothetical protein [Prevotellaceae bacterium]
MRKIILIAVLSITGLCFCANKAQSQIVYGWGDEKSHTVIDLPNDESSYDEELGGYVNIGYFYKQPWVLWIPMWNRDGKYCLNVEGNDTSYYALSDDELEYLKKEEFDLDIPGNPIPFWDKIGGKPLLLS